jgi:hypothetical protein
MDEKEFTELLLKRDEATLKERIERWKKFSPVTYKVQLPELLWDYIVNADEMYVAGYFLGVISLCASVVEMILADQIVLKIKATKTEVERFSLAQLIVLNHRLGTLKEDEAHWLDEFRNLRNSIIHVNVSKLEKRALKTYQVSNFSNSSIGASLYLGSLSGGGVEADALKYLRLVRDLSVKFYGENT